MGSSRTQSSALAARSCPQAATAYLAFSPLPSLAREIGLTRPLNSRRRAPARVPGDSPAIGCSGEGRAGAHRRLPSFPDAQLAPKRAGRRKRREGGA